MSNLLKQCYVVSSGTGTRIINSNDGVRQKLKELQQEQAPEQVDVSAEDWQVRLEMLSVRLLDVR